MTGAPGQAGPKSEANWTCEFCPAKFADLAHAEQHVRIEHPNAAVEDESVFELAAILAGNPHATNPDLARIILADPRFARRHEVQPAPAAAQEPHAAEVEAAFAGGMRVRTAPCTVEAHDREHFQVRTNGHWLCGHLLASVLAVQGIVADARPQPAPELAAATDLELAGIIAQRNQFRIALERVAKHASRHHCTCSVVAGIAKRALEGK